MTDLHWETVTPSRLFDSAKRGWKRNLYDV